MLNLRSASTLILFAGAVATLPPTTDKVREFGSWCVRPARLPFTWQALQAAQQSGDAREAFARGQQIMQLVPEWVGGHAAFVYNYVLTQDESLPPAQAAEAAEIRLYAGLAMLEQARRHAGKREMYLLHMAAFLPDLACDNFPGLRQRLREREQTGGAAGIAASYFAEIARLYPSPATREQALWYTPRLAAALLASGATAAALKVLDKAIARAPEIRDQELATEWQDRLREVAQILRGDLTTERSKILADRRFEPLWPYLR